MHYRMTIREEVLEAGAGEDAEHAQGAAALPHGAEGPGADLPDFALNLHLQAKAMQQGPMQAGMQEVPRATLLRNTSLLIDTSEQHF